LFLLLVMAALLFLPAWTLSYWQAWAFLAVFGVSAIAITVYLTKRDPKLLERRMHAGPTAVISTGPYKLVRHPMYMGALFLLVGIPLSLGSLWGLFAIALMMPALIWRLLNEETFLVKSLPGYSEYQNTVRHRLVPFIW
jgi:protein-S-isoprenylcysteine O-methyltransferase Ste14